MLVPLTASVWCLIPKGLTFGKKEKEKKKNKKYNYIVQMLQANLTHRLHSTACCTYRHNPLGQQLHKTGSQEGLLFDTCTHVSDVVLVVEDVLEQRLGQVGARGVLGEVESRQVDEGTVRGRQHGGLHAARQASSGQSPPSTIQLDKMLAQIQNHDFFNYLRNYWVNFINSFWHFVQK